MKNSFIADIDNILNVNQQICVPYFLYTVTFKILSLMALNVSFEFMFMRIIKQSNQKVDFF